MALVAAFIFCFFLEIYNKYILRKVAWATKFSICTILIILNIAIFIVPPLLFRDYIFAICSAVTFFPLTIWGLLFDLIRLKYPIRRLPIYILIFLIISIFFFIFLGVFFGFRLYHFLASRGFKYKI
jgi:hypothetical protein